MWAKLDDQLYDDPKALDLSAAAGWLIVRTWSYVGRKRTDGWVPAAAFKTSLPHEPGAIEELIERGFLHRREDAAACCGEHLAASRVGGYVVHDWLDYNPTRAENDVEKAKSRERKSTQLRKAAFARDGGCCRYCGVAMSQSDHRSDQAFQIDHVNPEIAMGLGGVVSACKECNTKKGDQTPSEWGVPLQPPPTPLGAGVDDPTLHLDELDPQSQTRPHPDPGSDPDPGGGAPGSGRDGSGRVGSTAVGSAIPDSPRQLRDDNPLLRRTQVDLSQHHEPELEPPVPKARPSPTKKPRPAQQPRRRKRKGRRR